jgi:hypothetical protein
MPAARFIFPGTTSFGTIQTIKIIGRVSNNNTQGKVRIVDISTVPNLIVAEIASFGGTDNSIHDMGVVSNLATTSVTWEVQLARQSGSGSVFISGAHLCT